MAITLFFFFLTIHSSFSLTFNLSTIGPNEAGSINCTGSAYTSNGGIQLTPDEYNVSRSNTAGRSTYVDPLHLWDRASGNLTDFTTHFSFVINSWGNNNHSWGNNTSGDGLTFFLTPVGSTIQTWSDGGSLGIGNGTVSLNSSSYQFVAVEFDTFWNEFDPDTSDREQPLHVGIDINSMVSVNATPWFNNITAGIQNDAQISYNATSMMLMVDFTGVWNNVRSTRSLSYVVDLKEFLPEYVIIGFSAATGDRFETHTVMSWNFSSSLEEINTTIPVPVPAPVPVPVPVPVPEDRSGLIVGLSVVVIFGVALAGYCLWKKKYNKSSGCGDDDNDEEDPDMDMEFEKGSGAKKFSYKELVLATKNFAEEEKLGEGGFGGVYKGFLRESDSYVAVKRVSRGSKQGLKEYASEVKIISQLRHRNLVQLLGWCHQRGELLLVYEFMRNGSLDSHLFKSKSATLAWDVRYNRIVRGLASALLYLHEEWERCVVHRDIKSSNIMLDSSFNMKLGDFGLARLVDHEKGSQTTLLAGTMGYMAPECVITGRASKETDVYSFGIVLLEIACGRRAIDRRYQENDNQVVLLEWVWSLYGNGKLSEGADPNLWNEFDEREMEQLMIVGLWCAHPDSSHRPSIRQAIHVLNFEVALPVLASTLPVPTYLGPTTLKSMDSSSYSGAADLNKYSNCGSSSQSMSSR